MARLANTISAGARRSSEGGGACREAGQKLTLGTELPSTQHWEERPAPTRQRGRRSRGEIPANRVAPIRPVVSSNATPPRHRWPQPERDGGNQVAKPSSAERQNATDDSSHVSCLVREIGRQPLLPARRTPRSLELPLIETDSDECVKQKVRKSRMDKETGDPGRKVSTKRPESPVYHDRAEWPRQEFSTPQSQFATRGTPAAKRTILTSNPQGGPCPPWTMPRGRSSVTTGGNKPLVHQGGLPMQRESISRARAQKNRPPKVGQEPKEA